MRRASCLDAFSTYPYRTRLPGDTAHMPSTTLAESDFTDGAIDVLSLLVKCGLCASRGEARRLVQQGGVSVGGEKVGDIETKWDMARFTGEGQVIKKGKKVYHKVML